MENILKIYEYIPRRSGVEKGPFYVALAWRIVNVLE